MFGYEIPEADSEYDIYFTEYFHEKERCSFPRFLKFPRGGWDKYHQRLIEESIKRVSQQPYEKNIESVQKLNSP